MRVEVKINFMYNSLRNFNSLWIEVIINMKEKRKIILLNNKNDFDVIKKEINLK